MANFLKAGSWKGFVVMNGLDVSSSVLLFDPYLLRLKEGLILDPPLLLPNKKGLLPGSESYVA